MNWKQGSQAKFKRLLCENKIFMPPPKNIQKTYKSKATIYIIEGIKCINWAKKLKLRVEPYAHMCS